MRTPLEKVKLDHLYFLQEVFSTDTLTTLYTQKQEVYKTSLL